MNRKERMYAATGSCVRAVVTMVVCSFLPLGAQSENDAQFDTITCKVLKVVDPADGSISSTEKFSVR